MTRTGMRHSLITQCEINHHDPSRRSLVGVAPRGQASLADEKEGTGKSCISWNNGNLRSKSNEMANGNNMDTRVKSLTQAHKTIASSPSFEPENISNLQVNPLLASNDGYGRSRSIDISMVIMGLLLYIEVEGVCIFRAQSSSFFMLACVGPLSNFST